MAIAPVSVPVPDSGIDIGAPHVVTKGITRKSKASLKLQTRQGSTSSERFAQVPALASHQCDSRWAYFVGKRAVGKVGG